MSKFAEWTPRERGATKLGAIAGLEIRSATAGDLEFLAGIAQEREGGDRRRWMELFRRFHGESEKGNALLVIAALDDVLIGYGKASLFTPSVSAPSNVAPEGWYLTGVIVRPEFRDRGAASALTRARLEWISRRSSAAYYFANVRNRVSIELHRQFGFEEMTRDFHHPEVTFEGGEGILFFCDLKKWRDHGEP